MSTCPRTTPALQVDVIKQVKSGADEAASSETTLTEDESVLPKAEVQVVDLQQAGLNRDANKKSLKVEVKNNDAAEEPTLQS